MANPGALKTCLDKLSAEYDSRFLDTDPVGIVHRYDSASDIEIAGFIVSVLSYGSAAQIRRSAIDVLGRAGTSPSEFARSLSIHDALETFRGFKHRWTDGGDIAYLFWVLGRVIEEEGSLGSLVRKLDNPDDRTIEGTMVRLSGWICGRYSDEFRAGSKRSAISYLIPSPSKGSACKRLAMFFRWMVRGPDGVDFGLWKFIEPSRLVIPLDRHIARMGKLLGLSSRRSPDWKMALEITGSLRRLAPHDPLKYDFALVRPGIVGSCTSTSRGDCHTCALKEVCSEKKA